MPDLSPFLATPPFRKVRQDYRLPATASMEKVLLLIASGPQGWDRNSWLGVFLAAQTGLRKGEICHARWSWLRNDDFPFIEVRQEEDFTPKDSQSRKIPLRAAAYHAIQTLRVDGGPYLVRGEENERVEEWGRRASGFLREHGLDSPKPLHELRKWFGSAVACRYGLTRAQAWLGHTSHQLTHDYYADLAFPTALLRFWEPVDQRAAAMPP